MSLIFLAHSVAMGIWIGYCVDRSQYGMAAGLFASTVIQILWAILEGRK